MNILNMYLIHLMYIRFLDARYFIYSILVYLFFNDSELILSICLPYAGIESRKRPRKKWKRKRKKCCFFIKDSLVSFKNHIN